MPVDDSAVDRNLLASADEDEFIDLELIDQTISVRVADNGALGNGADRALME